MSEKFKFCCNVHTTDRHCELIIFHFDLFSVLICYSHGNQFIILIRCRSQGNGLTNCGRSLVYGYLAVLETVRNIDRVVWNCGQKFSCDVLVIQLIANQPFCAAVECLALRDFDPSVDSVETNAVIFIFQTQIDIFRSDRCGLRIGRLYVHITAFDRYFTISVVSGLNIGSEDSF